MTEAEPNALIPKAMELFWHRGFFDTSIEEVVKKLGINRYAIYNTFGGKKELFLESLEHYFQSRKSVFFVSTDNLEKPLKLIRTLFLAFLEELESHGNGCFVCNTYVEVAPKDPQVAQICRSYQNELEDYFVRMLSHAQAIGEVRRSVNIDKTASALLAIHMGLGIRSKAGEDKETLLTAVEGLLDVIQA